MRIATWNVNGIRAREGQVREWIERERPDVVCLQELKAATSQVQVALRELDGCWCYWHGETSDHAPVVAEFAPDASGAAASGS